MPKTFIEGDWIQVGYYSSNNELVVIGGSYVTISYSYGKIRCEGEFFDIAGRAQGRFWSTDSNFDDLSLNYIFDGVDSSEGGLLVSSGFGRMRFESSSHFGSPQRFHAIISDPKTARMYSDFGYRSQAKSGLSTKQKWDLVRVRIESESNSPKSRGLAIENS